MQGRSRILIIEDDPVFRNLVVSLLRKDYLVAVATDGQSALEKAIGHRPDLVIIDQQMPGWDGVTTLKKFRARANFASTKYVMLTADASKETVMKAIEAGTDDYIIKTSFSKEMFIAKVNRLLAPMVARAVVGKDSPTGQAESGSSGQQSSSSTQVGGSPNSEQQSESVTVGAGSSASEDVDLDLMMEEWD